MIEREPKNEYFQDLEKSLKKKGYIIEKMKEGEWSQCNHGKEECFKDAEWYIEGGFYCLEHKLKLLEIIKQTDEQTEKQRQEKQS